MLSKSVKQHITKLHQKKHRSEFGEFLIEGLKGVEEALLAGAEVVMLVIDGARRDEEHFAHIIEGAIDAGVEVVYCGRKDVGEIKTTETYPGITAVISQPVADPDDIMNGTPVICLDAIADPGNLGTIIRTADWFGIKHILLGEGCVDPYNDKVVRSTMGSIFRTNIVKVDALTETLDVFKQNDYQIISLEMNGTDTSQLPKEAKTVYIFGSESHGIRPEISALAEPYTLAKVGGAESLNVAIATGIVMSEIVK